MTDPNPLENPSPGPQKPAFGVFGRTGRELAAAVAFLTRLPVPLKDHGWPDPQATLWAFPLVGAGIGASTGLLILAAQGLGWPSLVAVLLGLGAVLLLTGALHEDGLADCADALGARGGRDKRLAVMRDSQIGSYGVLALAVLLGLKVGQLAAFPVGLGLVVWLAATGALGRGAAVLVLLLLPPARNDGLGHWAGQEAQGRRRIAAIVLGLCGAVLLIAAAVSGLWLGLVFGVLGAGLVFGLMCHWAKKALGGQTGDVAGAAVVLCETAALLGIGLAMGMIGAQP
ncbi:MAG: adenosylcobinamide-GDP ribazoletransferase [Rhodospirillaceae bacterium]